MKNDSKSGIRRDILIYEETQPDGIRLRCVLLENGKPAEMLGKISSVAADSSEMNNSWREQDIILAQVSRIVPSLAAAFVDIGEDHEGMLPLKLAPEGIKPGQQVIVQIRRSTAEGKGSQLTARPQLPGFFAVCRPFEARPLKRSKLNYTDENKREEIFQNELKNLEQEWLNILQSAELGGSLPRLLARFQDPLMQALRDWTGHGLRQIQVEGLDLFEQVDRILSEHAPDWRSLLRLQPEDSDYSLVDIFRLGDLDKQLKNRTLLLKNGGKIVWDQTEALLAIDVNSGKAVRGRDPQKIWLETNMQAAEEIARLLRLKRFQGLAVIDFIRLKSEQDRSLLSQHLEQQLSYDSARLQTGGFTKLGLYELTRSLKKL